MEPNTEQKDLEQKAYEIRQKIKSLVDLNSEDLKYEMLLLKSALMENPAACSLLLPEDIGATVVALRRMTGVAIAIANAPKEKKPAAKKATRLTPAELQAQLSLIDDSDL